AAGRATGETEPSATRRRGGGSNVRAARAAAPGNAGGAGAESSSVGISLTSRAATACRAPTRRAVTWRARDRSPDSALPRPRPPRQAPYVWKGTSVRRRGGRADAELVEEEREEVGALLDDGGERRADAVAGVRAGAEEDARVLRAGGRG